MSDFTLDDLASIIHTRARSGDAGSYTSKLIDRGVGKCAQKLGEEAVEAVIAAVAEDRADLKNEAADVLYHLLVVLEAGGVDLKDVMAELQRRTAQTGLEEKASRPTGE